MDEQAPDHDEASPGGPPPEAAPPPQITMTAPRRGAGRRLLAAAVLVPWLLGYGITGAWAVTRGATSASAGLKSIDVGYTRMVTPGGVIMVGGLLLAGFAVLLATSLLLAFGSQGVARWAPVAVVAGLLTAGSGWAAVRGELHPGLWVLFFFGLGYAFVVGLVQVWRAARRPARGSVVSP